MRNPDYCLYGFAKSKRERSAEDAETAFNQLSMQVRGVGAGTAGLWLAAVLLGWGCAVRRTPRPPSTSCPCWCGSGCGLLVLGRTRAGLWLLPAVGML